MEIDTHVETSEEIEELTNQEIFDLAMRKEEEENEMETRVSEEIISNKDDFRLTSFLNILNKKKTSMKTILML